MISLRSRCADQGRGTRRPPVVGLLLAVALSCAGCVGLPESGPVVEAPQVSRGPDQSPAFIEPMPPRPGDTPADIVAGFLAAMRATPVQTGVARQYLASGAQARWRPDRGIITFADADRPVGTTTVSVRLSGAHAIDGRGSWQGPVPGDDTTLRFPMVVEDEEWRISQAPDALVVTDLWFSQRFRQVSLYFFDPTAKVLVPELVFVPRGTQLATVLTSRLLEGPGPGLARVSRSFFPAGSRLELSVTVSEDGVAAVAIQSDAGGLSAEAAPLAVAQLAWTLRQDPTISRLRLTFDGEPIVLEGGETEPSIMAGAAFDPTGIGASLDLYGLRRGRLVDASPGSSDPLTGPLSARGARLRSVALDLPGETAAGVTRGGDRVLVASVEPDQDDPAPVTDIAPGAFDLLPPAWDFAGRLWLLDRAGGAARVFHVRGEVVTELEVPGVTGRPVRSFLVSRDGSRLAAVVAGESGDLIVVSRIRHNPRGRVLPAAPATVVAGASRDDPLRIRALQWRSPTDVVALTEVSTERDELRLFPVDGSPVSAESLGWTRLLQGTRVRQLVSSPVGSSPMLVVTSEGVVDPLDPEGEADVDSRIKALTYVG